VLKIDFRGVKVKYPGNKRVLKGYFAGE